MLGSDERRGLDCVAVSAGKGATTATTGNELRTANYEKATVGPRPAGVLKPRQIIARGEASRRK